MHLDRRAFLSSSLLTVAVLGRGAAEAAPLAASMAPAAPLPVFTGSGLRELVGSRFHLSSPEWRGDLQLTEVVNGPESPSLEQFTAVFYADRQAPQAGLYDVAHPSAGRFQLRIDGRADSRDRRAAFALIKS